MTSKLFSLLALTALVAGCGQKDAATPEVEAAADAAVEPVPTTLPRTASAENARVFFVNPADGDSVSNPIRVEFGIEGMAVVKAGDDTHNSGHHHLLIDTDLPSFELPIPADANHVHFGDGSTATEVTLQPGEHKLQMLLGDHLHIPHDPPLVSNVITVTVE